MISGSTGTEDWSDSDKFDDEFEELTDDRTSSLSWFSKHSTNLTRLSLGGRFLIIKVGLSFFFLVGIESVFELRNF